MASATIPADHVGGIRELVGWETENALYHRGVLTVTGITQQALDDAVAAFDGEREGKRLAARQARIAKRQERIAAGVQFGPDTYSITDEAIGRWAQLAASLREEVESGETQLTDTIQVFTSANELREPTVAQFRNGLGKIGRMRRLIDEDDLDWTRRIAIAPDEATLDAIIAEINGA